MDTLMAASSSHSSPAAIHRFSERGIRTKADAASSAPPRK